MRRRSFVLPLVVLVLGISAGAKVKPRNWQEGKLLDTERTRHYAATIGSSDTTGTVNSTSVGDSDYGTLSAHSNSQEIPVYRVYQTYAIETADHVYVVRERIRWRWSKAARLEVNGPVKFAVEGDTVYLLGDDGSEHKTHMLKAILKSSSPSTLPPAGTASPADAPAQTVKQPDLATVAFKSTPGGADIMVDGKFVGSTPASLSLTPGDHSVLLQKSGFKDWARTLTVSDGGNQTVDAALDRVH